MSLDTCLNKIFRKLEVLRSYQLLSLSLNFLDRCKCMRANLMTSLCFQSVYFGLSHLIRMKKTTCTRTCCCCVSCVAKGFQSSTLRLCGLTLNIFNFFWVFVMGHLPTYLREVRLARTNRRCNARHLELFN